MLMKDRLRCKFPTKINNMKGVDISYVLLSKEPLFTQVIKSILGSQLCKLVKIYKPVSERYGTETKRTQT